MRRRFAQFAWTVLGFNLLVILWGALVRASKSGEGCGDHWPLCNGTVIPHAAEIATVIEFTHRATTGIAFIGVIVMAIWAWRSFRSEPVAQAAVASLVLIVMEALLGAGLVLFKYVGSDVSIGRAIYLSAHLVNTLIMLAAMTLTAWWGSGHRGITLTNMRWPATVLIVAIAVSVTGAFTALADTLFPAQSLTAGFAADFSANAHWLVRLRAVHPFIAALGGVFMFIAGIRFQNRAVAILVVLQLAAGMLNLYLLAPIWMQIVHLLFADLLWIALVLLAANALEIPRTQAKEPTLQHAR